METDNSYLYLSNLNKLLRQKPDVSQRDVSKALQMSLGMTNSLLKRFAEKGWIYMHKINAKNIRYALTPAGINELAQRSYGYVKRTMKSVVQYRDIFMNAVAEAKKAGCTQVFLVGSTDTQFLIEYACEKNALKLQNLKNPPTVLNKCTLIFFADTSDYIEFTQNSAQPEQICVDIFELFNELE